jgi:hypothetical protein
MDPQFFGKGKIRLGGFSENRRLGLQRYWTWVPGAPPQKKSDGQKRKLFDTSKILIGVGIPLTFNLDDGILLGPVLSRVFFCAG